MSSLQVQPTEFAIRLLGQTVAGSFILPPGGALRQIYVRNTTGNIVTGGLKFGTASGGVDVLLALPVGGNAMVAAAPLISAIQSTARSIFFDAVTLWNGANVDICAVFDQAF